MTSINNYNLFKEFLQDDTNDTNDTNIEDLCLITNENLEDNYIKLSCGHKFNYLPLHNEVVHQKTKKILDNSKLKINEIKCPYCRTINNKLLPYYKYYSVKPLLGVTHPIQYAMNTYSCEYVKNGKLCRNNACKTSHGLLCNKHMGLTKLQENILKDIPDEIYKVYNKKTIKELKEILSNNNLIKTGNKLDLINRLIININN